MKMHDALLRPGMWMRRSQDSGESWYGIIKRKRNCCYLTNMLKWNGMSWFIVQVITNSSEIRSRFPQVLNGRTQTQVLNYEFRIFQSE